MKRILTSLALLGAFGLTATAQRSTKVEAVLISPLAPSQTDPFDISCTDSFDLEYLFINKGNETITVADTFFWTAPGTPEDMVNYRVTTAPIPTNDTIIYVKTKQHRNGIRLAFPDDGSWVFPAMNEGGEFWLVIQAQGFTNQATLPVGGLELDTAGFDFVALTTVALTDCVTSIKETELNKVSMNVYPNPAADRVNFKFNVVSDIATARVTDIAGRTILVKDFGKQVAGEKEFTLDLSSLNNGMYYVELVNGGNRATSKITVSK